MKNTAFKNNLLGSLFFAGFLAITFFAAGSVSVSANEGDGDADCRSKACRQALVQAKQATARYHNVQNALADGFFQASPVRFASDARRDGISLYQHRAHNESAGQSRRPGSFALSARRRRRIAAGRFGICRPARSGKRAARAVRSDVSHGRSAA